MKTGQQKAHWVDAYPVRIIEYTKRKSREYPVALPGVLPGIFGIGCHTLIPGLNH